MNDGKGLISHHTRQGASCSEEALVGITKLMRCPGFEIAYRKHKALSESASCADEMTDSS